MDSGGYSWEDNPELRAEAEALREQNRKKAAGAAVELWEPTYPKPLGSVEEARRVIANAMDRFTDVAVAWQPAGDEEADAPPPPVHAVNAEIGTGKTRSWRERVATKLIAEGKHPVLAVPRHKLGDEIVRDFAAAGVNACVYRSREASDPDAPGERMCRDLPRVKEIEGALGNASKHACKSKAGECEFFNICGYQKLRGQQPDVWIVPHQLLFRQKPSFIKCDALAIDESFHDAALRGIDETVEFGLDLLIEADRTVHDDAFATNDLVEVSKRVHAVLAAQPEGRLSRSALARGYIGSSAVAGLAGLEWRRKREPAVFPGMAPKHYRAECAQVAVHNKIVGRLARFWELLLRTIESPDERSPWLELRRTTDENGKTETVVAMAWREDVHPSWRVPTLVMDGTLPVEIVRQFFPQMEEPVSAPAPMLHTRVRQITDRAMTGAMLHPSPTANEKTNTTRRNNVERVRRYLEVRAADVWPAPVLVVCQHALETELTAGVLPENMTIRHYNDITGENGYSDVALVILIGRTEPSARAVGAIAAALFGTCPTEIEPDADGDVKYPRVARGIRMRDGGGRRVENSQHPDPRAETVRWSICEANLIQSAGRGRGVNRTADTMLQIDILTNIVLPLEVDAATTWDAIQPRFAEIMRARGAVPLSRADMAAAYPDLFPSRGAAEMALGREKESQTPIEKYLIGVCDSFLEALYRPTGSRGPARRLLYDPRRIDPAAWLWERIGDVVILDEVPAAEAKPPRPAVIGFAPVAGFPMPQPAPVLSPTKRRSRLLAAFTRHALVHNHMRTFGGPPPRDAPPWPAGLLLAVLTAQGARPTHAPPLHAAAP